MATPFQIGNLTAEDYAQQQQIMRQQKMAQALMQNTKAPQGQMVGNQFVAPSFFQNLQPIANALAGSYIDSKADEKIAALVTKLRTKENEALADYMGQLKGSPAVPDQVTEMAGPYGQGVGQGGANVPMPTATIAGRPAIEANPMLANMNVAQNPYAPSWLKEVAIKKIGEGPKWIKGSEYNKDKGVYESYVMDGNSPNPESTKRITGVEKPAINPADALRLADDGLLGGGSTGVGTVGGGSMGGGSPIKPATNVTAPEIVKTYGYDPFAPLPTPAGFTGKQARKWNEDQRGAITGVANNVVTGAVSYVDALNEYKDFISGLSASDLTNPQTRRKLESMHSKVKLTGKEAYNLGVLNGGDERILDAVMPNYSDIMVTKNTLNDIINGQLAYGGSRIVSTYRTNQKPVPENLRQYVAVEKTASTPKKEQTKNVPIQRAMLGNMPIETRNGKWVYSNTGKDVEQ